MKLRKTPPTRGLVAVVWHVLLCFFIFSCCAEVSGNGNEHRSAIEHLPLWLLVSIFVLSPLVVFLRLAFGPSPWDIQSHKEEAKNLKQNDQGK
jgi:hypothetical protein